MRYGHDYRGYDRGRDFGPRGWQGGYYGEARGSWAPRYEGYGYPAAGAASRGRGVEGDVRAADLMTANPEAVTPDTPLMEVAKRMRDLDVGIIPVVDGEDTFLLQGVITDRDIAVRAAAEGKDMKKAKVRDFMTPEVGTVDESDGVREVLTVMKRDRVRRVPVTDEEGRLVGIIAQADLAVDYAGLDFQREAEVEEVIERISEPGRPRWGRGSAPGRPGRPPAPRPRGYDRDMTDYLREGWHALQREARQAFGRGAPGRYDRGWW
jgi:CBS domain-containing protein